MLNIIKEHSENLKSAIELEGDAAQFEYLIDIGKNSGIFDEKDKNDTNKMNGCLAQVWIKKTNKDDKFFFDGDSDALIVKGLVKIITEALSGYTSEELKNLKHNLVNDLGLGPGLSARRQVGMMAMVDHIKIITDAK